MRWSIGADAPQAGGFTCIDRSSQLATMSTLTLIRNKIYKTVARQLHGQVPCWVCGEHVLPEAATLEHIKPRSEGGNSHAENLAISHAQCNQQRHALGPVAASADVVGKVRLRGRQ
jgi:5-methylcytosine-specific restriction endonuclease McrA